jgi:long-chain fatty acid transport protein
MSIKRLALLSGLIGLIVATGVFANGVIRDGVGAISAGRGGTNIANYDNGSILLDNPAGMVNMNSWGLTDFGVDVLFTDIDYGDTDNPGVHAEHKPFPLGQASYITKAGDGEWAYGVGVFVPAGFGAEYDMVGPAPFGTVTRYKSLGALAKFLPGVACRVTDRLSVGGTFGLAVSHAELEAPFFLQNPGPLQGTPTMLDLQASGATTTWSVGMQYELNECTMFGLSYQDETRFKLDGNALVAVPGLGSSRFDADVDLVWPRSLGAGLLYSPCAHHRLSCDVIWYDWSHAFDRLDLRLSNPTNPVYAGLIGNTFQDSLPFNWHDSISVRLGHEWFVSDCSVLRMGYVYNSDHIPSTTLTPFIPAILEHTAAVGIGHNYGDYRLDLGYQFSFGDVEEVTTSSIIGGDFNNSRNHAQAHWGYVGISREF